MDFLDKYSHSQNEKNINLDHDPSTTQNKQRRNLKHHRREIVTQQRLLCETQPGLKRCFSIRFSCIPQIKRTSVPN